MFLSELSNALMEGRSTGLTTPEGILLYLEDEPQSNLSNLLEVKSQERKFELVAEDILETFLDSKALNCEPVKVFLRQILAGLVLEMTLKSCSRPDFINGWIVYLLEVGEPDIPNVIDAGVGVANIKEMENPIIQPVLNGESLPYIKAEKLQSAATVQKSVKHQRTVNRAEEAMEDAMLEAKRLTELIAASEDAKHHRTSEEALSDASRDISRPESLDIRHSMSANGSVSEYSTRDNFSSSSSVLMEASRATTDKCKTLNSDIGSALSPVSSQSDLNGGQSLAPITIDGGDLAIPQNTAHSAHTTFDQILSPQQLVTSSTPPRPAALPPLKPLTLHYASVTIFDDALPGEKPSNIIRSKPNIDYLLQIEPASSQQPGWMLARQYSDFETLHEVLRRISVISGVSTFTQKYSAIPTWKNQTKSSLRQAMETYLREALVHPRLAESEGMKRFLEKDQSLGRSSTGSSAKGLLAFPTPAAFEAMGKGMLDVLAGAPKGAAGGGKALFEGVSGVFGQKKPPLPVRPSSTSRSASVSSVIRSTDDTIIHGMPTTSFGRTSQEIARTSTDTELSSLANLRRHPTESIYNKQERNGTDSNYLTDFPAPNNALVMGTSPESASRSTESVNKTEPEPQIHLPPPPSEIPDDYSSTTNLPRISNSTTQASSFRSPSTTAPSSIRVLPHPITTSIPGDNSDRQSLLPPQPTRPRHEFQPLTEQETQVSVELFFATITELYTLSSAWFRRTILAAAKSFLLRPGNPQLDAIRVLLQDTVIDANSSDIGLATHILKIRENSLPTEEELKMWPPPLTELEQERLRAKARKLLIEKGMPAALTSVMGAAASGEALGRIFDALQVEQVGRGLIFALLLQGIRALTH